MNDNLYQHADSARSSGTSTESEARCHLRADREQAVLEVLLEHPLVKEALGRLIRELRPDLTYHNLAHTLDVLHAAVSLGLESGLDESDLTLIAIAAAWHDTGFIVQRAANEPIGARFAREAMERTGGFSPDEVADVEAAIIDTQLLLDPHLKTLVQKSSGRLSPWLLDADLSNIGRPDFLCRTTEVFTEMTGRPVHGPEDLNDEYGRAFVAGTVRLLARHCWLTRAAQRRLNTQKRSNLEKLGVLLAELHGGTQGGLTAAWDDLASAR